MKLYFKFILLFAFIALIHSSRDRNNKRYKLVCYWGSWSFYRPGDGKFSAEDTDPNLCTHLVYGFTKLNADNKIAIFDPDLDVGDTDWNSGQRWGRGMYRRFNKLRSINPHLTTIIAIGGWNEGSDKYSLMASNSGSRRTFVQSVVQFLKTHDFDGLDLDWEYPGMKAVGDAHRIPGNPIDKENFVTLLRELKEAFEPHGFLLTAAVSAGKPTIDRAYNVPEMNKYLDIISVMTYDFHGGWENKTGHNAPLYPKPNDNQLDKEFTTEFAVNYWIDLGADPQKMVLGMPLYGRTFTLKGSDSGIHADAMGAGGNAGPFTRLPGTLGYNEICQLLKQDNWKIQRDSHQKIPYAVKGNQWIGYDDVESIMDKVEFLKSKGLGGGMVWSIDTDDFKGLCGRGRYPLLKAISEELDERPDSAIVETPVSSVQNVVTTIRPTVSSTVGPTVGSTVGSTQTTTKKQTNADEPTNPSVATKEFSCVSKGSFKDPKDPSKFHVCVDMGIGRLKDFQFSCGAGTVYDEVIQVCTYP